MNKSSPCCELSPSLLEQKIIDTHISEYNVLENTVKNILADEMQKFQQERPCDKMTVKQLTFAQSWRIKYVTLSGILKVDINAYFNKNTGTHVLYVHRISGTDNYDLEHGTNVYNFINIYFNPSAEVKKSKMLRTPAIPPSLSDVIKFTYPYDKHIMMMESLRNIRNSIHIDNGEQRVSSMYSLCVWINKARTEEEMYNTLSEPSFQGLLKETISAFTKDKFKDIRERAECALRHMEVMFDQSL